MLERAVQEIGFLKRRQTLAKNVIRALESKAFFLEELVHRAEINKQPLTATDTETKVHIHP
jgi:hypothetical protein